MFENKPCRPGGINTNILVRADEGMLFRACLFLFCFASSPLFSLSLSLSFLLLFFYFSTDWWLCSWNLDDQGQQSLRGLDMMVASDTITASWTLLALICLQVHHHKYKMQWNILSYIHVARWVVIQTRSFPPSVNNTKCMDISPSASFQLLKQKQNKLRNLRK